MDGGCMVLTTEMMDAIEKSNVVFLATANKHKNPNLVPIGLARPLDDKTILLVANFMNKTYKNLKENPKAAIVIGDVTKCPYQFKGTVKIHESGKYFDDAVEWAKSVMTQLEPKGAVLLNVEEIYSVQPGPEAGKKVD
jgi:predicted pyridoxine 5'-phosphate oxidase superfamily flavin-nucleotide-binding protein